MTSERRTGLASLARKLAGELSDFRRPTAVDEIAAETGDEDKLEFAAEFDRRVLDPDLRSATESRFLTAHYADAVESGVKALCECIRSRIGSTEDGDALVRLAFSPDSPLLPHQPWTFEERQERTAWPHVPLPRRHQRMEESESTRAH